MQRIGTAVIGAGYWGPNLARNIANHPSTALTYVCDLDVPRATQIAGLYSGARATSDLNEVLADPAVDACVIATPASTHADVGIACLRAGKHVLIEKPLAESVASAERLLQVAEEEDRVVMCDHTYCYTSSVQYIRKVIEAGELGDVLFADSVRINLGLVQPDVNVIWDLAPHDLSILDYILPEEQRIVAVGAQGSDPIAAGQECVGHLTLDLGSGCNAHVHVNWLSPTKIRTMVIGGSRKTLVWDDLNPVQRIAIYDRSVDLDTDADRELRHRNQVSYRIGDMVAPALSDREALGGVVEEFAAGIRGERRPVTDGHSGLRILRALEASDVSLAEGGVSVPLQSTTVGATE